MNADTRLEFGADGRWRGCLIPWIVPFHEGYYLTPESIINLPADTPLRIPAFGLPDLARVVDVWRDNLGLQIEAEPLDERAIETVQNYFRGSPRIYLCVGWDAANRPAMGEGWFIARLDVSYIDLTVLPGYPVLLDFPPNEAYIPEADSLLSLPSDEGKR